MKRSHLETYVEIVILLAQKGPLELIHIMHKTNLNCSVLEEDLGFLVKQGLVEERPFGKDRIFFAVTQRGINVLKYFSRLKVKHLIVEEARNIAIPL